MVNYEGLERQLKEKGIKKSDLTRELGISSRTIAKISKGEKISERIMKKIADYLNCSSRELYSEGYDISGGPVSMSKRGNPALSPGISGQISMHGSLSSEEQNTMKKIVIFGGGTGISSILSGLKLFPVDVTAVIAVSDDGSSTGVLKEELDIPAVGDLGKVLLSMANVDEDFIKLLRYRFHKTGSLQNHPVRNITLAALIDLKGDLTEAARYMGSLLRVRGTVLPLTEEKVELIGHGKEGDYIGEVAVGQNIKDIEYITYDHPIKVNSEVVEKVLAADLIILSSGSLYTSIIPHLLSSTVKEAISASSAPIMYIANLVTQPGETDGYSVSDHIKVLNRYLGGRKVDIVLANNGTVSSEISERYRTRENKYLVDLDIKEVESQGARIVAADFIRIGLSVKMEQLGEFVPTFDSLPCYSSSFSRIRSEIYFLS